MTTAGGFCYSHVSRALPVSATKPQLGQCGTPYMRRPSPAKSAQPGQAELGRELSRRFPECLSASCKNARGMLSRGPSGQPTAPLHCASATTLGQAGRPWGLFSVEHPNVESLTCDSSSPVPLQAPGGWAVPFPHKRAWWALSNVSDRAEACVPRLPEPQGLAGLLDASQLQRASHSNLPS